MLARMHPTEQRILVIGAGYVGLVTAVGLASLGHRVEVVETRPDRLDALAGGRVPIFEAGAPGRFDRRRGRGRLTVRGHPARDPTSSWSASAPRSARTGAAT